MTTLSDLLVIPSKDAVLESLIALARLAGFPTASWQPGSVPRRLFEAEASALADLHATVGQIARAGFLDSAEGGWLDLIGASQFSEARKPAVFAQHIVTVTAAPATGPHTVTPGAYWVATAGGLRFVAITGSVVPVGPMCLRVAVCGVENPTSTPSKTCWPNWAAVCSPCVRCALVARIWGVPHGKQSSLSE